MATNSAQEFLLCPNHPDEPAARRRLAKGDDDQTLTCPRCSFSCPNFLKYPVVETLDTSTGEVFRVNMLTGKREQREEEEGGAGRLFGYIRTSLRQWEVAAGMNPETQRLALASDHVPDANIFSDVGVSGASGVSSRNGWRTLRSKVRPGDTLVVAALDRIGRRALDTHSAIIALHADGVRVRTLADNELFLNPYLDAPPESAEAAVGNLIISVLVLVSQMERDSIARRTKAGLDRARAEGKQIGRPWSLPPALRENLRLDRAAGWSWAKLAARYGISRSAAQSIVARAEQDEGA